MATTTEASITVRVRDEDGNDRYVGVGAYVHDKQKQLWRVSEVSRTGSTGPNAIRVWLENARGSRTDGRYTYRRVWRSPASLREQYIFVRDAPPVEAPTAVTADDLERLVA